MKRFLNEIDMAWWLDVSPRQLRSLAERKIATRSGRGEYDVERTVRDYVHHLRCVAAAVQDGLPGDSYVDRPATE
jgi:hypothetical protein